MKHSAFGRSRSSAGLLGQSCGRRVQDVDDRVERIGQVRTDQLHHDDGGNCDKSRDQTLFDRCNAIPVLEQAANNAAPDPLLLHPAQQKGQAMHHILVVRIHSAIYWEEC